MSPEEQKHQEQLLSELLKKRQMSFDIDRYMDLKHHDHSLLQQQQILQEKRNKISKAIGFAKANGEDATKAINDMQEIKQSLEKIKEERESIHNELFALSAQIPNALDPVVPEGIDEKDNVVIAKWGNIRHFDFPVKDHIALGQQLNGLDFEKAAHMSRSRFVILQDAIASLHRALANFMLDIHLEEHGYTEVNPPLLVNQQAFYASGQWPKFQEDLFYMKEENLGLIPTSEVALVNLIHDELIDVAALPYRWVSYTPCFRREAGSYGRDTKGMIRQHQFEKVELVQVVLAKDAESAHESMCMHSETILQHLELPYQKVLLCSGDTGFHARKTYDLEVWLPSQKCYREIASISQCGDFQAKRLGARAKNSKTGQRLAVHTLNGSALAVGRTLIALLENHQKENGGLHLPSKLLPYLNKRTIDALQGS